MEDKNCKDCGDIECIRWMSDRPACSDYWEEEETICTADYVKD